MKRLIVFLTIGPALGLCATLLISMSIGNRDFHDAYIGLAFFLVIAAICGVFDAVLSRFAPLLLRLPLTAIFGVALCGLLAVAAGAPLTSMPRTMSIVAVCMGLCSWLSRERQQTVLQQT